MKHDFSYTYEHGGDAFDESGEIRDGFIDFSANINPLGIREEVKNAVIRAAGQSDIYPDTYSRRLSSAIAEFEGTSPSGVFVSNGASDIIFRLMYSLRPKKVMVTAPSFSDYERAARASGAAVIRHFLSPDSDFEIGASILEKIRETRPDIVIVCNPNNPTGNLTGAEMMREILDLCGRLQIYFLADECFLDFSGEKNKYSLVPFYEKHRNLIVLKAFTKIFAIPGVRLGYALASDEKIISGMRSHGPDWAVSNLAQAAGCAALENCARYLEDTAAFIKKERGFVRRGIESGNPGVTVYPSHANYLLFRCGDAELDKKLYGCGIIVRRCENYHGLGKGYYRAAVLSREKNLRLVESLRRIL